MKKYLIYVVLIVSNYLVCPVLPVEQEHAEPAIASHEVESISVRARAAVIEQQVAQQKIASQQNQVRQKSVSGPIRTVKITPQRYAPYSKPAIITKKPLVADSQTIEDNFMSLQKKLKELSKLEGANRSIRDPKIVFVIKEYDDFIKTLPDKSQLSQYEKDRLECMALDIAIKKLEIDQSKNLDDKKKKIDQFEKSFNDFATSFDGKKITENESSIYAIEEIRRSLNIVKFQYKEDLFNADISKIRVEKIRYITPSDDKKQAPLLPTPGTGTEKLLVTLITKDQEDLLLNVQNLVKNKQNTDITVKNLTNVLSLLNKLDIDQIGHEQSFTLLTKQDLIKKITDYIDLIHKESFHAPINPQASKTWLQKIKDFFLRTKSVDQRAAFFKSTVDKMNSVLVIGSKNSSSELTRDEEDILRDSITKNEIDLNKKYESISKAKNLDDISILISKVEHSDDKNYIADKKNLSIASKQDVLSTLKKFKNVMIAKALKEKNDPAFIFLGSDRTGQYLGQNQKSEELISSILNAKNQDALITKILDAKSSLMNTEEQRVHQEV